MSSRWTVYWRGAGGRRRKKGFSPRWSHRRAYEPAGQMPDTVKDVVDDEEQAADVVDALLARKS